jgi:hypothetical protein
VSPDEQPRNLRVKVFRTIVARFQQGVCDISRFAATGYSFGEWLNWEAFAACSANPRWKVQPKPSYCSLGLAECKDFGDLLVADADNKVLVEIGLVHDGTGDKWRPKLDRDVQKLARPLAGIAPLQMIVLVSKSSIEESKSWQRWLAKVPCWGRDTDLAVTIPLSPTGVVMVRGWQ